MKLRLVLISLVFSVSSIFLPAQDVSVDGPVTLRYIHTEGETARAEALVREQVYLDGFFSHDAEITETSVVHTRSVGSGGEGDLEAEFITLEKVAGRPGYREWVSSEKTGLRRFPDGRMDVPDDAARPVIRDIPVFPGDPVVPGDTWIAPAREVHVFRIGGRLWGPYSGDLLASYEYLGWNNADGTARIALEYDLHLPVRDSGEPVRLISGKSVQVISWDVDLGRLVGKVEDFEFLVLMADGSVQEIIGSQEVSWRYSTELDREDTVARLIDSTGDGDDLDVRPVDDGVLVTLNESSAVLFDPESSRLRSDQLPRLEALARVLGDYADRDLLITGHTADYGSVQGRQELSLERARTVAEVLFPDGRPGPGVLYLRGAGAEQPVGSDAENRRVEILILD